MEKFIGWFISIMIFGMVMVLLIAALVGFILVQIKARPIWRFLSLMVALLVLCSFFALVNLQSRYTLEAQYSDTYGRGAREFIQDIDQMSIEGRTNDVHQSCQKFLDAFILSTDKVFVTNFDQMVYDTSVLADQTNAALKPVAAPTVSTNK